MQMDKRHIEIAIFAHNEEDSIEFLIDDLARQSLLKQLGIKLRIRILCNGCTDLTVPIVRDSIAIRPPLVPITVVDDFKEGGKSRTWNRFIDELPDNSDFIIFIDGDIRIPDADALLNLLEDLLQSDAVAVTSRPLKDLHKIRRNPLLRAVATLIGSVHRDGPICGQLYSVKSEAVRQIRLPVPCLVEDGFLSACIVTSLFTDQGQPARVKASSRVSHYFETPGTLREFFHHDVRLALGVELNAALYSDLWAAESIQARVVILRQFAESSGIDRSIDEHMKHPEKRALIGKKIFSRKLLGNRGESFPEKTLRFPFRLAHSLYMAQVRNRARILFNERRFNW